MKWTRVRGDDGRRVYTSGAWLLWRKGRRWRIELNGFWVGNEYLLARAKEVAEGIAAKP